MPDLKSQTKHWVQTIYHRAWMAPLGKPMNTRGAQGMVVACVDDPMWELLNHIRWDAEFARGYFELGYFDRVECQVLVVPFSTLEFDREDARAFRLADDCGRVQRIPFHRVRAVRKITGSSGDEETQPTSTIHGISSRLSIHARAGCTCAAQLPASIIGRP